MSVRHLEECGVFSRDARCDCGANARAVKELWPAWNELPATVRVEALKVAEERRVTPIAAASMYEAMRAVVIRSARVTP